MSDLGELDRPGARDARPEEWLVGTGETGVGAEGVPGTYARVDGAPPEGSEAGAGGVSATLDGAGADARGESVAPEVVLEDVCDVGAYGGAFDATRAEGRTDTVTPERAPRTVGSTPLESADSANPARKPPARRGAVDPVKALVHRHRDLCERAVDPLEIAAGLEAHGLTDRTASRFRHRDVFSLAEEMYARVPRDDDQPPAQPAAAEAPREHWAWAALALLPGALCAATVIGMRLTAGRPRLAVAAIGALAVALGLRAALRRGPLRAPAHATPIATRAWTCWLLAYALLGDGLLRAALDGGPDGLWPAATAPVLALALACGPAVWCARLFAVRARRRLAASRGLEDFAASAAPLLLGMFGLFLCALGALLALCAALLGGPAAYAGAGALGALLLLSRLLTAHGFSHAPAVVLGTATAVEAMALASVFAGRLPGCSLLATPVETLADAWGADAVPALVCALAALTLLIHATRTLTRASAHARPPGSP
ncbi:hypothetical protein ABT173_25365 [Streptomyces sp. NPDC001795]|uniref:hypothetical protein n=1 Tax=unclassified Streptomyces TaxID=2593676 RepID=UPI00332146A0